MAEPITLDLPLPPSVNKIRRINWASYADYKRWREDADKCLMLHKQNKQSPILVPCSVLIEIAYDKLIADPDNILKGLLDYCVSRGFLNDDRKRFLREIILRFTTEPLPEGCRVTLSSTNSV